MNYKQSKLDENHSRYGMVWFCRFFFPPPICFFLLLLMIDVSFFVFLVHIAVGAQ